MKTSSFPVHLCLTRVAITPLIWDILSWIFGMLFITALPATYQNTRTIFCTYVMISQWIFYGSQIRNRLFSSRNQGVPRWPYLHLIGQATHAWPRDVSPCAPLWGLINNYTARALTACLTFSLRCLSLHNLIKQWKCQITIIEIVLPAGNCNYSAKQ